MVYWVGYTNPNYLIKSCTFSNCAATTQTTRQPSARTTSVTYPTCDPANNEIIWVVKRTNGGYVIRRASATGTNQRTITSLSFPNDGTSWSIANSGEFPTTDKLFYSN